MAFSLSMLSAPQMVQYANAEQDPLQRAGCVTDECERSSARRRSFALAFTHLRAAAAALDQHTPLAAAIAILQAYYVSEGFAELSATYCDIIVNKTQQILGAKTVLHFQPVKASEQEPLHVWL